MNKMSKGRGRSLWPLLNGILPICLVVSFLDWCCGQESQGACVLGTTLPS